MTGRYSRLDRNDVEKYRAIETYGAVWLTDHYFLPQDQLPDWLKDDPSLDLSQLDLRFKETPKAKKIPDFVVSAGKSYLRGVHYDTIFKPLIGDFVTAIPLHISGDL